MQKFISSANNEDLKYLARLVQNARERRKSQLMVLEGIHLIEAALDAGHLPAVVFINEDAKADAEVTTLLARLPAKSECIYVARGVFAKVSALASAPEVLAICPRPQARPAGATASCVLLEDIQDPGNLGTILRSAAAADVREVFLSKGCVDVYSPKVLRSGMGAHFALSIHESADLAGELSTFPGRKLVTHLAGSTSLYGQDLSGAIALVMGNEGAGVSDALLALSDVRVRIPMPGHAESLNVAMAATICLFERVRQLQG
ncbi:TrmH family RNA methyltransferase [Craterilacuibacter sp.]|uniref:TrmH family RNA methyltransferase n=1 Tax=Craterilacuibacter sp. TaxID=2870909 RepID=UPI003F3D31DC